MAEAKRELKEMKDAEASNKETVKTLRSSLDSSATLIARLEVELEQQTQSLGRERREGSQVTFVPTSKHHINRKRIKGEKTENTLIFKIQLRPARSKPLGHWRGAVGASRGQCGS